MTVVHRKRLLLAPLLLLLAALVPGGAAADSVTLVATVGPGAVISLTHADGSRVVSLDPGTYDVVVHDRDEEHNFRLTGPGVNRATSVEATGTETWTVTLVAGTYRFVCDPHATTMRGSFLVGGAAPPPPPATPRLAAAVGPGPTITLRTAAGKAVKTVRAGRVSITVNDRSAAHNFHLLGPGVNRKTGVAARGRASWTVTLAKGKTYTFFCDPHKARMRGSFRAT